MVRLVSIALLLFACALATPRFALAERVDVELVLSVDSSGSIDSEEFALQREGYARALMHPEVLKAIASGPYKTIALTLVEWSGPGITTRVVDWTRVAGKEDAEAVAVQLLSAPRVIFGGGTAVGAAILHATADFDGNGFEGSRRVIDISGDGYNNRGISPQEARTEALRRGLTINALAVDVPEGGLKDYFRRTVIGGPGAFVISANGFADFHRAVVRKLVREIYVSDAGKAGR